MKYTYFVIIFESSCVIRSNIQKRYENPTNSNNNETERTKKFFSFFFQKIKTEKNFPHKINFYGCMAVCVCSCFCMLGLVYASRLPALKVYLAVPTSFMYKIYIIKAGYFIQKTQNVYGEYNVGAELTK